MQEKQRTLFGRNRLCDTGPPLSKNNQTSRPNLEAKNVPDLLEIPQDLLNIDSKIRSNLLGWRGQFSPQLVEAFLKAYAPREGLVLDPFVGSGTVLCEAGRLNLRAFGGEINPGAIKLAQVYRFINWSLDDRAKSLDSLESQIRSMPQASLALFGRSLPDDNAKDDLLHLYGDLPESPEKILMETLIVTLDFREQTIPFSRVISKFKALRGIVLGLPKSSKPIELELCDARSLPLNNGSVDIVVTSPPYINVFNYHQQHRTALEALGWRPLRVANSEIGSNRKNRQNRFLTVIQYCLDMALALQELYRVCKTSAHIVMVVGRESNVRKTPFFNGDIVECLVARCSQLRSRLRQERVFKNKFGHLIREDILHLSPDPFSKSQPETDPREVARDVLASAESRAPKESIQDLRLAQNALDLVKPSPICEAVSAREI